MNTLNTKYGEECMPPKSSGRLVHLVHSRRGIDLVGGVAYCHALLGPLEALRNCSPCFVMAQMEPTMCWLRRWRPLSWVEQSFATQDNCWHFASCVAKELCNVEEITVREKALEAGGRAPTFGTSTRVQSPGKLQWPFWHHPHLPLLPQQLVLFGTTSATFVLINWYN